MVVSTLKRLLGPGPLLGFLILMIAVGGAVGTLWYLDVLEVPFLDPVEAETLPPPNLILVPISGRKIPAYTQITRDDLWNPQASEWSQVGMDKTKLPQGILTSRSQIRGRVLRRDKEPGYLFNESDFLPKGTRSGLVAGIPPGKRGMRIDTSKVQGLEELQAGDQFDLVATIPVEADPQDLAKFNVAGAYGKQLALQASMTNALKRATVSIVVHSGIVVKPMTVREVPYQVSTFTAGSITRTRPALEVVIAIDSSEVQPLNEAIAIEAAIMAVPHSGRPEDAQIEKERMEAYQAVESSSLQGGAGQSPFSLFSPLDKAHGQGFRGPLPNVTVVESIHGTKREVAAVPHDFRRSSGSGKKGLPDN